MGILQQINGFAVLTMYPEVLMYVIKDIKTYVNDGNRFALKLMAEILLLERDDKGYTKKDEAISIIERLKMVDEFRIN